MDQTLDKALKIAAALNESAPLGMVAVSERLYYTIMEYTPKKQTPTIGERHERYADLQLILSGKEKFGVCRAEDAVDCATFDEESDFVACQGKWDWLSLQQGEFVLVFPWDIHAPSYYDGCDRVKKAVFKIALR